jgi:uncharacterized protein
VKTHALIVNVAELLRRPSHRLPVHLELSVRELGVTDIRLDPDETVSVDVVFESLTSGIIGTGTVSTPWVGECRRCLTRVAGTAVGHLRELFEVHPTDEDVFPIVGEQVDLEPLVLEAVLLDLPIAPLCKPDCLGLCVVCGVDRNQGDCGHTDRPVDPRWAALESLRDQLDR